MTDKQENLEPVALRLTKKDIERVDALAKRDHMFRGTYLRKLISEFLKRRKRD